MVQKPQEDAIITEGDGHFKEEQLATQTQQVGIIHPPPDIRSIVVRVFLHTKIHVNTYQLMYV